MKILLFGASGQIGSHLRHALAPLGTVVAPTRAEADFNDAPGLRACIREEQPGLIVNAAAWTAVDQAESEPGLAFQVNAEAPHILAQEAQRGDAWLVHYSTDYVFDGEKAAPYTEHDQPAPLSIYGRSKLAGEEHVRSTCARHLILRTGWVYSAHGTCFPTTILRLARERERLRVVADQFGAPTPAGLVADLTAHALRRLLVSGESEQYAGTYHLVASGSTSWFDYARYLLELAHQHGMPLRASAQTIDAISATDYAAPAARPRNSRLDTTRFRTRFGADIPDWQSGVAALVAELARQETT